MSEQVPDLNDPPHDLPGGRRNSIASLGHVVNEPPYGITFAQPTARLAARDWEGMP